MKNLKIGIDIRFLSKEKRSGIEEYTINLLKNLIKLKPNWQFILFYNSWQKELPNFDWLTAKNVSIKNIYFPSKLLNLLFLFFNWPKIDKLMNGIDIFFMPNFALIGLSKQTPLVLTVHDLSFFYFPKFFSLRMRLWYKFLRTNYLLQRANQIIAVSNSTKNDLIKFFPKINLTKISVVPHGISKEFRVLDKNDLKLNQIKEKFNLSYRFILYLGIIEPRKNIDLIIKAFDFLKRDTKFKDLKLVIVGGFGWQYKGILNLINDSSYKKDIILITNFDPDNRVYFYNLAEVFVYPSFFEGFGLPIVEAMACGIPVITSNVSSLPEVADGASILINPFNVSDLISAIKQILLDKELKSYLVSRGLEQIKKYSWERCALETIKIFEKVI